MTFASLIKTLDVVITTPKGDNTNIDEYMETLLYWLDKGYTATVRIDQIDR